MKNLSFFGMILLPISYLFFIAVGFGIGAIILLTSTHITPDDIIIYRVVLPIVGVVFNYILIAPIIKDACRRE